MDLSDILISSKSHAHFESSKAIKVEEGDIVLISEDPARGFGDYLLTKVSEPGFNPPRPVFYTKSVSRIYGGKDPRHQEIEMFAGRWFNIDREVFINEEAAKRLNSTPGLETYGTAILNYLNQRQPISVA